MYDYRIDDIERLLPLWRVKDDPDLWPVLAADADKRIRLSVAGCQGATPEALKILASDPDVSVRRQLSRNPKTPVEALEKLAADIDLKVKTGVAAHRDTPSDILKMLADEGTPGLHRFISQNTNTFTSVLARYVDDPDHLVRINAVKNVGLCDVDLWRFAHDPSDEIRRCVFGRLRDMREAQEVITYFIGDKNYLIRGDIASDQRTPIGLLQLLSVDKEYRVRLQVALNPNSTEEILEALSYDKDEHVRHAVASVAPAQSARLLRLAEDQHDHVRSGVAGNANTPYEILKPLARDESKWVREAVAKNASLDIKDIEEFFGTSPTDTWVEYTLRNRYFNARRVIAEDPNTASQVLVEMARSDFDDVHTHLAENPALPAEAMDILSMKRTYPVIMRLLERRDIPHEVSSHLLNDPELRVGLAYSRDTKSELLDKLCLREIDTNVIVALAENANVSSEFLSVAGSHDDDRVRINVAGNPVASADVLRSLARDEVLEIRKAAATNRSTPTDALEMLAEDKSEVVRLSLLKNRNLTENAIRKLATDPSKAVRKNLLLAILAVG